MHTNVALIPTLKSALFAVACALAWAAPMVALAEEDETRMTGAACLSSVPRDGDAFLTRDHATYNTSSSETVPVVCPIARNVIASVSLESATMIVSGAAVWDCEFLTYNENGTLFRAYPPTSQTNQDVPPGMVRLVWGVNDSNVATSRGGAYNFFCHMPPNSTIYAYHINENDGED